MAIERVKLVLTEAVDIAAKVVAKQENLDWDTCGIMTQTQIKEVIVGPIAAAAPYIVQQVLNDIASRMYEVE